MRGDSPAGTSGTFLLFPLQVRVAHAVIILSVATGVVGAVAGQGLRGVVAYALRIAGGTV